MPPKPTPPFVYPYEVKGKSSHVTIYSFKNRRKIIYQIRWHAAGEQKKKGFSNEQTAHAEAKKIVATLDRGQGEILTLTAADKEIYISAINLLKRHSKPLHSAISEYVAALDLLKGNPLLPAIHFYLDRGVEKLPPRSVPEVYKEFLAAKEADKLSRSYVGDCRVRLGHFARDFTGQISNVRTAEIDEWLRKMGQAPKSRNNYRGLIIALFNFAKRYSYLPRDRATEADGIARAKERSKPVEIYSVEEMERLLKAGGERTLPFVVLSGFAGMRPSEIGRLTWDCIEWDQKLIRFDSEDIKTPNSRRLIPLLDCAAEWLEPYKEKKKGLILQGFKLQLAISTLAAAANVKWKKNALRHSFASYRLACFPDTGKLALEMGNSPQVIFRHYRRAIHEDVGKRYFSLVPDRK